MMQLGRDIERIFIVRTDRFGEFILNIPAIRAVRKKYPASHIAVLVNPTVKEIIEGTPFINEVIIYDGANKKGFLNKLRFIFRIKKSKFDLAIILNPGKEFNIMTFFAGIPIRLGYNRKWGFLLTHKIEDRKSLGQKHEVEYNLDLVRRIGIDTQDKSLFISVDKQDERFIDSLLKELGIINTDLLIALHPWTSDSLKQWPVENFSQLAKRLLKEFSCKVIIIGGKEEIGRNTDFSQENPELINLTGELTLRQSAVLLKKCRLLVSNDSGPVHLACAVGTPVIALFRNDIPAKSARRWGPWGEGHTVIEKNNLGDISVDEVLAKIQEALNR